MRVSGKNVFNELDISKIRKVYLSKSFKDKDILNYIKDNKIKYVLSDSNVMDKMVRNNQGIIVEIDDYSYFDLDVIDDDFVIMLDHLEDPHNFGAIIRTAESIGVKNIIIPKDRSVMVTETVMKTSAGTLNHVNIIRVTNLVNAINYLKDKGFFIYGAEADGIHYKNVNYSDKKCLVVGSEGKGLSSVVRNNCDEIVSLPMKGHINSLNASVAAGILIYEMGN
ncbi:MAG: 23S rRNA (guanosine(2251)-2'-O)-methyltransferase RlmB [Bacilli bacterium]|nr:23S rRNA (guanosine(2251)-2'-O)-methyltransferase RlmB [Bacilli bacterium]